MSIASFQESPIGHCIVYLSKSIYINRNCYEYADFLQNQLELEGTNWHAVITYANTSYGIKIQIFFGKNWGDDVVFVQCHLSDEKLNQALC